MPQVSVIIPTYNRRDWLIEAIESVLAQDYKDYELIVIDHGSTDGTSHTLRNRYGSRIRILEIENCSLPACPRNAGIREAKGKYVAFLDSDDLWVPGKLNRQVSFLEKNPQYAWSYGNTMRFGKTVGQGIKEIGHWQFHSGRIFESLLTGNFIPSPTVIVRKECFKKVGLFDMSPDLRTAEDYELWMRLAYHYNSYPIKEVLAFYRVSEDQMTKDVLKGFYPEKWAVELIKQKLDIPSKLFNKSMAALHLRYFRYGVVSYSDSEGSLAHLLQSRKLNPFHLKSFLYGIIWKFGKEKLMRIWISGERLVKKIVS